MQFGRNSSGISIIIIIILHYVYVMLFYSTYCSFAFVCYILLQLDLHTDYITHTYALSLRLPDTRKFKLLCNLLNWIRLTHCIIKRKGKAFSSHREFLVYCSFGCRSFNRFNVFNLVIG